MKYRYDVVLILGLILAITVAFKPASSYFDIAKNLDIFATLFKEVNTYYVDEVEPTKLIRTGIDAMLGSLDPYTNFIPEEDADAYRTMTTGEYAGIGSLIGQINGKNIITMPNEGFPAHQAGIRIGDEIIKIDGTDVKGKSTEEVSILLKGKANTPITLTIQRMSETAPIEFSLIRKKITIDNVPYYGLLSEDIGYIKLSDFTTHAGDEVKTALKDLLAEGATSIVLDIRGNPGGLLHEAVNICNLFLPKGTEIVSTKGKVNDWNRSYKALNSPIEESIPLVVLTNRGSASASEIVAGVMQDYDRGVIVGGRTFGKGLIQITRPLTYNTQLKVTTGKYYTPSGRSLQSIDYKVRQIDGSPGQIPDSLRVEFETTHGRKVMDGSGIVPDVSVSREYLAPVTVKLLDRSLIFDYATRFYYENDDIGDPRTFSLTDLQYQEFVEWLEGKDYNYVTVVEQHLQSLIANSKKENYYEDIKDQLTELQAKIMVNKSSDLIKYRGQIQEILEREISARYHLLDGEIEASLDSDKVLQSAISILNDPARYKKILNH